MKLKTITYIIISLCVVSLSTVGYYGIYTIRNYIFDVSVTGSSVRHVVADFATMAITIETDASKDTLNKRAENMQCTMKFLKNSGITDEEITNISSRAGYENTGNGNKTTKNKETQVTVDTIYISSKDVKKIQKLSKDIYNLLSTENITLHAMAKYTYENLEEIKLDMIGDATANLRKCMHEITKKGNIKIKGVKDIKDARFSILPENPNCSNEIESVNKIIKVEVAGDFIVR